MRPLTNLSNGAPIVKKKPNRDGCFTIYYIKDFGGWTDLDAILCVYFYGFLNNLKI